MIHLVMYLNIANIVSEKIVLRRNSNHLKTQCLIENWVENER